MEPISALLVIAGSHGAAALVKSLTGVDELGQLSGELVRALTASESRIDERLDRIESSLDDLLDQSYGVAVRRGLRYLLDATGSRGEARAHDLDRARDAFVEATAAARGPLQQAVAERYLLLVLLGLGRRDAVPASLARVEEYATANAFDALRTSELSQDATAALLRREGGAGSGRVGEDRLRQARKEVKRAAVDSIGMTARLLAEMALMRPALGLPEVSAPPVEPIVDELVMTTTVDATARDNRTSLAVSSKGESTGVAYWTFTATPGRPLRLGSLTVTVSPEPAPAGWQAGVVSAALVGSPRRRTVPVLGSARVETRAPLPMAVAVASNPAPRTGDQDAGSTGLLAAGGGVAHVPLARSAEGTSWVRITPQWVHQGLIEVTCPST